MDDIEDIEQYSDESGRRLQDAAKRLVELIQRYTVDTSAMHGGSSERRSLFDRNEALAEAVSEWNERAFDHTGTTPLLLEEIDEEEFEDEADDEETVEVEGQVSVVSRWDLNIVDLPELLTAGRAAHRRLRPEETEKDATVAVASASHALYAITHEAGEPLFGIPGIDVLGGARVYVVPDEPLQPLPDGPEQMLDAVKAPAGEIPFSEGWQ